MLSQVVVANDLTVAIGNETVRLTPAEGFQLAERIIRRSTSRMIDEEIATRQQPANDQPAKRRQRTQ
jgi:hypothetical protein